jgi:hypothetical protein
LLTLLMAQVKSDAGVLARYGALLARDEQVLTFTCFASAQVQILTQLRGAQRAGHQGTFFTGTKVTNTDAAEARQKQDKPSGDESAAYSHDVC